MNTQKLLAKKYIIQNDEKIIQFKCMLKDTLGVIISDDLIVGLNPDGYFYTNLMHGHINVAIKPVIRNYYSYNYGTLGTPDTFASCYKPVSEANKGITNFLKNKDAFKYFVMSSIDKYKYKTLVIPFVYYKIGIKNSFGCLFIDKDTESCRITVLSENDLKEKLNKVYFYEKDIENLNKVLLS